MDPNELREQPSDIEISSPMDLSQPPHPSHDYYSQLTQTQQLPSDTQDAYGDTSNSADTWPKHLWGALVSVNASPSTVDILREKEASIAVFMSGGPNVVPYEAYVPRPSKIELNWNQKEFKIGRHPKADLCLKGKKISSWHARIWVENEDGMGVGGNGAGAEVRLEDTSTNGTVVRNQKVGKGNVTILQPGDEIIFGSATTSYLHDFRFIFQGPSTPSSQGDRNRGGGGIHEKYDVREQVGKGSFATVRKGIRRSDGKMMAIKIILKARFASDPKTMLMIQREVEIMKDLDHKYCVRYIDFFEDEERMWLVMDFSDGGDLLDYVMSRGGLKESETREIALMVCEAVAYLHSKGVAHRDIKPENLLLSKGSRPLCKVTDFGLAKMVDNNTMLRTMCGTPTYLAPEVILNEHPQAGYGNAVDAWSIGIVLYSCLTNSTPFDESETTPLRERIEARVVDFAQVRKNGVSELAIDFLDKLLKKDPTKRMSVQDSLKHPWLATTVDGGAALPLLVSSLPFNAGAVSSLRNNSVDSPTVTSGVSMCGEESFGYSQKLHDLRLNTPGRSLTSFAPTTPDRSMEEEIVTEAGDERSTSFTHMDLVAPNHDTDDGTIVGIPTPRSKGKGREFLLAKDSTAVLSPLGKRKVPASAFSSNSSLGNDNGPLDTESDQVLAAEDSLIAPPLIPFGSELAEDVGMELGEGEKEITPTKNRNGIFSTVASSPSVQADVASPRNDEMEGSFASTSQSTRGMRGRGRGRGGAKGRMAGSGRKSTAVLSAGAATKRAPRRSEVDTSCIIDAVAEGEGMTTRRRAKVARLS